MRDIYGKSSSTYQDVLASSIDLDALRELDIMGGTANRSISDSMGNGCFMDPPGFPTYFTRSIYTPAGNSPHQGATEVILYEREAYITRRGEEEYDEATRHQQLMKLWRRPDFDSARTQAWLQHVFGYMRNAYVHPTEMEYGQPRRFAFPVPSYELRTFKDDPRFSDDWRQKVQAEVEAYNAEVRAYYAALAVPENHSGVRRVRTFYPEAPLEALLPLIENPPTWGQGGEGDWYKYLDARPDPAYCPGEHWQRHPVNGTWCQFCGWEQPSPSVEVWSWP